MKKKKSKLQKKLDDPNSSLYKHKADKLWKELIFNRFSGKCAICGSNQWTQAHHLVPREMISHRHNEMNGMLLCAAHHRFSFVLSPHKAPIAFAKWMIEHRSEHWNWLLTQEPTRQNTTTSFKEIIQKLENDIRAMERQAENKGISNEIQKITS
jgi:hypothetical protein